ncbi:LAFE_0G09934g1_1 [Lachancea fermentati]|uniref:Spindle pole component 29 n=1 Tax=Lachancea fermentati TaxID=4955 RepID=A0A1G4MHM1_LACFM|nr:LAFE_0G09934g1_1 [Lachancea fermentati]
MNHSSARGLRNMPEADDTLHKIRRDYLMSKKNLQELLTASSTRLSGNSARIGPLPTPPLQSSEALSDEKLRQQIRQGLQKDEPPLRSPQASLQHMTSSADLAYLRQLMRDQQRQIDDLTRRLHSQSVSNKALQDRVTMLEDYVSQMEASNRQTRKYNYNYTKSALSSSSSLGRSTAPSESYDAYTGPELDNTNYLLDLTPGKIQHRDFSNLDDSTTRLLQLAQNAHNPSK